MKHLFTYSDTVFILDSRIDGQPQLRITDLKGFPVGSKDGFLTVPVLSKDLTVRLGRGLNPDEFIIDPLIVYSKLLLESKQFEKTNHTIPLKYKIFEIWKYLGEM